MKNQTKAVIASIVVIALALTAVSGITYSWFSDSEKANIKVSTAVVDYGAQFEKASIKNMEVTIDSDKGAVTISNLAANASGTITCKVTNDSTIATKYKVVMTPTLDENSTLTNYDLANVNIKVGTTTMSLINGLGSDYIIKEWSNASVGDDASISIQITTPTSYGGETPGQEVKYNSETGVIDPSGILWDAQTVRSGLILEFKIIAVQSDYSENTSP